MNHLFSAIIHSVTTEKCMHFQVFICPDPLPYYPRFAGCRFQIGETPLTIHRNYEKPTLCTIQSSPYSAKKESRMTILIICPIVFVFWPGRVLITCFAVWGVCVTGVNVIHLNTCLGAGQPISFCIFAVSVFVWHLSTGVPYLRADLTTYGIGWVKT